MFVCLFWKFNLTRQQGENMGAPKGRHWEQRQFDLGFWVWFCRLSLPEQWRHKVACTNSHLNSILIIFGVCFVAHSHVFAITTFLGNVEQRIEMKEKMEKKLNLLASVWVGIQNSLASSSSLENSLQRLFFSFLESENSIRFLATNFHWPIQISFKSSCSCSCSSLKLLFRKGTWKFTWELGGKVIAFNVSVLATRQHHLTGRLFY